MIKEGDYLIHAGRPIARMTTLCRYEPMPWAAFEEVEFISELNAAWANIGELSDASLARLAPFCPGTFEAWAEAFEIKTQVEMLQRRVARRRIVGALKAKP
jgi:hypothetical protein